MKQNMSFSVILVIFWGIFLFPTDNRPGITRVLSSPYFNTSFLRNYEQTYQKLCADGFEPVSFTTQDGLTLHGLYLARPQARSTVICCAGWLPGRKEGIATFFPILPQDCNILFFDARGHGKSDGWLWADVLWYGQQEYKDIIAAIDFVHDQNPCPIVLLGLCAGAFHATHAVLRLPDQSCIAGIIFDSGWVSVDTASCSVVQGRAQEYVMKSVAWLYGLPHYKEAKHTLLGSCISTIADWTIRLTHSVFFKWAFLYGDEQTNLAKKIQNTDIEIPILFIHAYDDTCVAIDAVQEFALYMDHAMYWWIEDSSKHACNHLKYTVEYMDRVHTFIDFALKKRSELCQVTKDI